MDDENLHGDRLVFNVLFWTLVGLLFFFGQSCGSGPNAGPITGPDGGLCSDYRPTLDDLNDRVKVCLRWYPYQYFDGVRLREFWACGEWIP